MLSKGSVVTVTFSVNSAPSATKIIVMSSGVRTVFFEVAYPTAVTLTVSGGAASGMVNVPSLPVTTLTAPVETRAWAIGSPVLPSATRPEGSAMIAIQRICMRHRRTVSEIVSIRFTLKMFNKDHDPEIQRALQYRRQQMIQRDRRNNLCGHLQHEERETSSV